MTDKLIINRAVVEQVLMWFEWSHKGNSIESPASSHQCSNALRAALAEQPAGQEPVAYVCLSSHVTADGSMEDGSDYLEWADEASDYEKRVGTPLYTAPQPAKRVPLTDDEIDVIVVDVLGLDADEDAMQDFARAIEAAVWGKK